MLAKTCLECVLRHRQRISVIVSVRTSNEIRNYWLEATLTNALLSGIPILLCLVCYLSLRCLIESCQTGCMSIGIDESPCWGTDAILPNHFSKTQLLRLFFEGWRAFLPIQVKSNTRDWRVWKFCKSSLRMLSLCLIQIVGNRDSIGFIAGFLLTLDVWNQACRRWHVVRSLYCRHWLMRRWVRTLISRLVSAWSFIDGLRKAWWHYCPILLNLWQCDKLALVNPYQIIIELFDW